MTETNELRVLLVEDSEDDAELVVIELEGAGYRVDWRRVETEAEYLAALRDVEWDIIISDFQMPSFDGLRAFELFKRTGLDTPFIFVSGAIGEERAVEAMRAGARDYLLKGNLARLAVAVKRELAEARNRRRRRLAEEATRREQLRLAAAVEASGAGIFEHSLPFGADTYFSERWREILGYAADELPGTDGLGGRMLDQVHPDDRAVLEGAYAGLTAGRSDGFAVEVRMRSKPGGWVNVAIFAKASARDDAGRATGVVGVMLDLTERKRLEAQLRQAQKMEAVGRLAGGVAHDFNNLLTVVFSFGGFVLEALHDRPDAREDMQEVLSAANKAASLTAQLLAFSRHQAVSPRVLNLNEVIRDVDRMLRRLLGEDIDVASALSPSLWNVRMDPNAFEQVLVNLAVNARDAMPEGGRLTIETDNVTLEEGCTRARGADIPPGDYVVIAVSDDGVGMDEQTQRMIFEPFFTTKEAGKGTGLGLSTCYGIVSQAGGYISLYSEPGRGTTFRIYLPRVADAVEPEERRLQPERLEGRETVLVAEDDAHVRKLAIRILSRLGYRVIEAESGPAALRACEAAVPPIDLLLTDVVMPGMSGKQLVNLVAELRPAPRILYMSGYTPNAIAHRGVLGDGAAVLQKPFTPDSLARKVREVLDG